MDSVEYTWAGEREKSHRQASLPRDVTGSASSPALAPSQLKDPNAPGEIHASGTFF